MTVHRLFFAAWPDAATRVRVAAVAGDLATACPARWIRPARYHLTLCFLGTFRQFPARLVDQARQAAARLEAPSLVWMADRVDGFAARRPPCVLRASREHAALRRLHRALLDGLAARGVEVRETRAYRPHVTLGYGCGEPLDERPVATVEYPVDAVVLLHSISGEDSYRTLGRWSLGAAPD